MNIDDLRKIAESATPGPWITGGELPGSDGVFFGTAVDPDDPDEPGILLGEAYTPDAEFIATFNPETVLALLDRVETAEQALQRIRDRHKPHRDIHKPDPSVIQANWFCCGAMQLGLIAPTDCNTCGVDYPCPEIQALEGDE